MKQSCIWLQNAAGEVAWVHDDTKKDDPNWSTVTGELCESELEFELLSDVINVEIQGTVKRCKRSRPTWRWRGVIVKQGLNIELHGVDAELKGGFLPPSTPGVISG